jgi:23S rRNA (cytosine1962-C5)-methyltransferase
MSKREEIIVKLLKELTSCETILARNDAPVRQLEGLPLEQKVLYGTYAGKTLVKLAGISYELDLRSGQKTGFYLDQAENYAALARYAPGRSVLDCFTNQGAFALSAMKAGAKSCMAIDQSLPALEVARATADRAGLAIEWRPGNVFDLLPLYCRQHASFDLIILDPPSFTKNKENKAAALRGYHELHLQALRLLQRGGILATFSCSHHVTAEDWKELLEQAGEDNRCSLRLREQLSASSDHPVLVNVPETEYLRGYVLEKL